MPEAPVEHSAAKQTYVNPRRFQRIWGTAVLGQELTLPPLLYTGHSFPTITRKLTLDNGESEKMSQRNVANGLPVLRSIQLTSLDPANRMISATTK